MMNLFYIITYFILYYILTYFIFFLKSASARGTGIQVIHQWNQVPRKRPLVVQSYVQNPYLINDTKFDIRLYVLVTSINPFRIYLYEDGLRPICFM